MKFNLEIEIDWIDEESNLDEAIKKEIIESITSKIEAKISKETEKKVTSQIDELTVNKINTLVDSLFKDFTDRPITISDSYGDVLHQYDSITKLIKARFDKFLEESVDKDGKTYSRGSYGQKFTRLTFLIDKQLKDFADKFTTDTVKQVSEEIQKHVKDGLTNKLGKELMHVLKVDEMLRLNGKNK